MRRRSCEGSGVLGAFRAAVANLERHVDEVNTLNVYPVPDGDTGANMLATVRAALAEAEAIADAPAHRVAQAISFGALMGARGNSGVITSQVFRGLADGLAGKTHVNGLDLANAMQEASKTAYGAVARPVEGTILTVVREAADAAVTAAEADDEIESVLAATLRAAEKAVAKTPSLLPILREAGVVDAGGQGLYRLLEGAHQYVAAGGTAVTAPKAATAADRGAATAPQPAPPAVPGHPDEGYGYETMFLVEANGSGRLDLDAIRTRLEAIGVSVLVAGDARLAKVHVHSPRPDEVIAYGLTLGTLSRISVENLDGQARDVQERRAAAFVDDGAGAAVEEASMPVVDASAGERSAREVREARALGPAVVAVVAGGGLRKAFESFGVDQIVEGGQSANPSTGELLRIARLARAREVLVLPNNPNVRLAAEQAARMCSDKRIVVVPTRNAAEGLAAILALDPTRDAGGNAPAMTAAARAVQTFQVTEAVRDATIAGRKVKKGQTIVLDPDEGLIAAGGDRTKAVLSAVESLRPGFELVTLYYGDGADLAEAEAVARRIGEAVPGAEVEVVHGGQPHYRYLVAAE